MKLLIKSFGLLVQGTMLGKVFLLLKSRFFLYQTNSTHEKVNERAKLRTWDSVSLQGCRKREGREGLQLRVDFQTCYIPIVNVAL